MSDAHPLEMTPEELVAEIESGQPLRVLDVRAPQSLASGAIDIVEADCFDNIVGSAILGTAEPEALGLHPEAPTAVVCARGVSSLRVTEHLAHRGHQVRSVAGGMQRWMSTLIARDLEPPPSLDELVQFDRIGKGALSYLLVSDGEALVVDPPRLHGAITERLGALGARLTGVVDTHAHADYISGGAALATAHGAPYHLHPADSIYPYDGTPGRVPFEPLAEGQLLRVGRAELEVVHTPGHTEGSVSLRMPSQLVLTGDLIFISSVGRPDLGERVEDWTPVLYASLARAKREWSLPERLYPAHYASARERAADHSIGAPLAHVLTVNEPLAIDDAGAFTRWILDRVKPFPASYRRIKAINVGLEIPSAADADLLELGRNQCALG